MRITNGLLVVAFGTTGSTGVTGSSGTARVTGITGLTVISGSAKSTVTVLPVETETLGETVTEVELGIARTFSTGKVEAIIAGVIGGAFASALKLEQGALFPSKYL